MMSIDDPAGSVNRHADALVNGLVGKQLIGVTFVLDYCSVQFEDTYLTIINPWRLELNRQQYTVETPGFRDALCAGISHVVAEATIVPQRSLRIVMDIPWILEVLLRPEDYVFGPEGVILHDDTGHWNVY